MIKMELEDIISQILKDDKKPSTIFIETSIESIQPKFLGLPLYYHFVPILIIKNKEKEYTFMVETTYECPSEESVRVYAQFYALEQAVNLAEKFKKNSKKTKVKINDLLPEQTKEIINLYCDEMARIACEFGGY